MKAGAVALVALILAGCARLDVRRTYSIEYERDGQRVAAGVTLEPPARGLRK